MDCAGDHAEVPSISSNSTTLAPASSTWQRLLHSPVSPAWLVFILYLLWLGIQLPYSHDARDFIHIGRSFIQHGHGSSAIVVDSYIAHLSDAGGYDGQWTYYIALDPLHAAPYIDMPSMRMARIVYPMLVRLLSLGQALLIPYMMLAVNLFAMSGLTLAIAAWLRRRRLSPWFSLIPGLYPGFLVCVKNDLTEPLACALAALGVYLLDTGRRTGYVGSAIAFAFSVMTRETTAVFPLLYGLGLLLDGQSDDTCARELDGDRGPAQPAATRIRAAAVFLAISLGPSVAYRLFLKVTLGGLGIYGTKNIELLPFGGLIDTYPWQGPRMEVVRTVYFPALICGCICITALYRNWRLPQVWVLLANVIAFTVLLTPDKIRDMIEAGRDCVGVVMAAIYCIPDFDRLFHRNRAWLWSSAAFWLALMPFWLLIPIVDSLILHR